VLAVRNLDAFYGSIQALRKVSLHISPGEIVALIGANGAGKSTLLNSISGLVPLLRGEISFFGRSIVGMRPEDIVHLGISQVPEGRQIFSPLSVVDNLMVGAYQRYRSLGRKGIKRDVEEVFGLFPILRERKDQPAGTLSGGEQQMLAIGRALMSRPKLLLLDEPSMGLAPRIVVQIFDVIKRLRDEGTMILLVEQNAKLALNLADRGYVLETGRIVLEGTGGELLQDREIERAYLGRRGFLD